MNLLFLSPWRLIPACTCSVTPAGAAGICKHSWCVSASECSHLTSPRHCSPRMPRITQIHTPGRRRGTCSWCRLIRGAQCFCQAFCRKGWRNKATLGAGNLVHIFRLLHSCGQSSFSDLLLVPCGLFLKKASSNLKPKRTNLQNLTYQQKMNQKTNWDLGFELSCLIDWATYLLSSDQNSFI